MILDGSSIFLIFCIFFLFLLIFGSIVKTINRDSKGKYKPINWISRNEFLSGYNKTIEKVEQPKIVKKAVIIPKEEQELKDEVIVLPVIEIKDVYKEDTRPEVKSSDFLFDYSFSNSELSKYYLKNKLNNSIDYFSINIEYTSEEIVSNIFSGVKHLDITNKFSFYRLKIINAVDPIFNSIYFGKNDLISLDILIDLELGLLNLFVRKETNDLIKSIETGNYLFKIPSLTNVSFGNCQFSYFKASSLLKIISTEILNK